MNRKVLNYAFGDCEATLFNRHDRDNCCEPYLYCQTYFRERGVDFLPSRDEKLEGTEWVLFWDVASTIVSSQLVEKAVFSIKNSILGGDRRNLFRLSANRYKCALIVYEPYCVCARNWNLALHAKFDRVFTWDPGLCTSEKYVRIGIPHGSFHASSNVDFASKKLICDVTSNKIPPYQPNKARVRYELIRFFCKYAPNEFDLYGAGWNPSLPRYLKHLLRGRPIFWGRLRNWRGLIRSKADVLPRYKFILCIENSSDRRGYISNKIFDAFQSGCVPVYLGPPDRYDYLPKGTFIDLLEIPTYEKLLERLRGIDSREHREMLDHIRDFLASERHHAFSKERFAETLYNGLLGT